VSIFQEGATGVPILTERVKGQANGRVVRRHLTDVFSSYRLDSRLLNAIKISDGVRRRTTAVAECAFAYAQSVVGDETEVRTEEVTVITLASNLVTWTRRCDPEPIRLPPQI